MSFSTRIYHNSTEISRDFDTDFRGIIFHSEFSDTDLTRLKLQHIIFLFVKRGEKKKIPKPFHSHTANSLG